MIFMSTAEKKLEMVKILLDADEETTGKLIEFYESINESNNDFTKEELAEFERRSEEYYKNPEIAIPWEEALSRIKMRLQK